MARVAGHFHAREHHILAGLSGKPVQPPVRSERQKSSQVSPVCSHRTASFQPSSRGGFRPAGCARARGGGESGLPLVEQNIGHCDKPTGADSKSAWGA